MRADFAPLMTSRARFSCAVRVRLSRANRFAENDQTARQDFGWSFRSQAGSARRAGSLSLFLPFFGVTVSMTCPSVNASPCQRKCDSRSTGALVTREPTMNPRPSSSRSSRLAADSMPASATTTMASIPCRAWNCRITGRIVCFSALSPS